MLTVRQLLKLSERNQFSSYLPYFAYDDENGFFYNQDGTVGYIFEIPPISFMGADTVNMIKSLFSVAPDGSVFQFILFSDPYIDFVLDSYRDLKVRRDEYKLINEAVNRFSDFLKEGSEKGIDRIAGIPVRYFRAFFTLKIPKNRLKGYDLKGIKHNIHEILHGAGLPPTDIDANELLNFLRRLFNDRILLDRGWDARKPLNKQVILAESEIYTSLSEIRVGKKVYRCITPKLFPKKVSPFLANQLIGGVWGVASDAEQITKPFLFTLNIYKDDKGIKAGITTKANIIFQQQGFGSLAPSLARRKEEFVWAIDEMDNNTRFLRILPLMWIYAESSEEAQKTIARVKRIWESKGFTMQEDKGILPILFISTLPFGLYTEAGNINKIDRDFTVQDEVAGAMAPVQADFHGGGKPILLFVGRKGQLISVDMFDKHSDNYNALVAASTGSGKCRTDGQILMKTGFCDLREIQEGDKVLSDNNGTIDTKPVLKTFSFKNEKTVKIKTKFGRVIQCTPDHRVKVENATWVHAEDLKKGDILPVRLGCMRFGDWGDERIGYLLGVLYANGAWSKDLNSRRNINIYSENRLVLERIGFSALQSNFGATINRKSVGLRKPFKDFLKKIGAVSEKELPRSITINASESFWIGFMNGMLDMSAIVDVARDCVKIPLHSKKLAEQVRTVLEQGFGIVCHYQQGSIVIKGTSLKKFAKRFTTVDFEKQENLESPSIGSIDDTDDLLPEKYTKLFVEDLITLYRGNECYNDQGQFIRLKNCKKFTFEGYKDGSKRLSRREVLNVIKNSCLQNDALREWQNFLFTHYFDEVVSVEPAEDADVYDVAVEDTHNYFADGQINHNSFLVNFIVFNHFSAGDKIRIIDIGGSYRKLVHIFNGRFLEFTPESKIILNPFTYIQNIDDETAIISAIVKQMVLSSTGQISVEIAETADTIIKDTIRTAYRLEGNDATIDTLYNVMQNYDRFVGDVPNRQHFVDVASFLAFNIKDFTSAGTFGRWFNGKSTFNIADDEFVVLELEHLKPQKELFKVITLQVINAVTRDLYLSDRNRRKLIIFDEAWQFLEGSDIFADVIEEGYRRARKYNGSFSIVVQSLLDLKNFGRVGDVIRANSAWKFLLASPDFEKAKMDKIIDYDDFVMRVLKTVKSNKPKYSEIFIDSSAFGVGVARLVVDNYTYFVFTSDPKEIAEIERIVKERKVDYSEAIYEMVRKYRKE